MTMICRLALCFVSVVTLSGCGSSDDRPEVTRLDFATQNRLSEIERKVSASNQNTAQIMSELVVIKNNMRALREFMDKFNVLRSAPGAAMIAPNGVIEAKPREQAAPALW